MNIVENNKRGIFIVCSFGLLLMIPVLAMQLTDEVNWTIGDFIVAGLLLMSTGFFLEIILRKVKNKKQRILLGFVLFLALVLLWAELAVGIFDSPLSGS
ncbi:hypothetical protein [Lutimonas sp.]|uniref:hypothetical protein n=1 Tax=Lutimonas sp. TaxID=1872403 RepID=UPI003D9B304F